MLRTSVILIALLMAGCAGHTVKREPAKTTFTCRANPYCVVLTGKEYQDQIDQGLVELPKE